MSKANYFDQFDDTPASSAGLSLGDNYFDRFDTATTEYSAVRSGAVDFLESALGVGDELDAAIRVLSGEADNYSQGIQQSRAELDAFERANPGASKLITAVGFGAGLFVPGAGLAKIAQTGSKLDRAFKVATLGNRPTAGQYSMVRKIKSRTIYSTFLLRVRVLGYP